MSKISMIDGVDGDQAAFVLLRIDGELVAALRTTQHGMNSEARFDSEAIRRIGRTCLAAAEQMEREQETT